MTKLAEIEAAIEVLTPEDKQKLLLFLATQVRAEGATPPPLRKFSRQQIEAWIREDEEDLRRLGEKP